VVESDEQVLVGMPDEGNMALYEVCYSTFGFPHTVLLQSVLYAMMILSVICHSCLMSQKQLNMSNFFYYTVSRCFGFCQLSWWNSSSWAV